MLIIVHFVKSQIFGKKDFDLVGLMFLPMFIITHLPNITLIKKKKKFK